MSNKQSSVESLFEKLWDTPKDKFTWYAILEEHKAIHQQEIENSYDYMRCIGSFTNGKEYYNEKFNNEQQ